MSKNNIESIFEGFGQISIMVIGDAMVDSYIYGKVERISPEAPVPVVSVQRREKRLGGAANVALNLKGLGANPIICSIVGRDNVGDDFLEILNRENIPYQGIVRSNHRKTTLKERILAGSQQMMRVDEETDFPLFIEEENLLKQKIEQQIEFCQGVVFEDYDKGTVNEEIIRFTIELANQKGIPVVVDPKKKNFLHYKGATLFKPNFKELKEGLKLDIDASDMDAVWEACAQLKQALGSKYILTTLSDKGMVLYSDDERIHLDAHLRKIADVSGAGDTVISLTILGMAMGLPMQQNLAIANLAGGLVCEYLGVVPVSKEDLLKEAIAKNILAK
jgi:D-glycero-beta-D-manno-heptose-7-phosphate kinase